MQNTLLPVPYGLTHIMYLLILANLLWRAERSCELRPQVGGRAEAQLLCVATPQSLHITIFHIPKKYSFNMDPGLAFDLNADPDQRSLSSAVHAVLNK